MSVDKAICLGAHADIPVSPEEDRAFTDLLAQKN